MCLLSLVIFFFAPVRSIDDQINIYSLFFFSSDRLIICCVFNELLITEDVLIKILNEDFLLGSCKHFAPTCCACMKKNCVFYLFWWFIYLSRIWTMSKTCLTKSLIKKNVYRIWSFLYMSFKTPPFSIYSSPIRKC